MSGAGSGTPTSDRAWVVRPVGAVALAAGVAVTAGGIALIVSTERSPTDEWAGVVVLFGGLGAAVALQAPR